MISPRSLKKTTPSRLVSEKFHVAKPAGKKGKRNTNSSRQLFFAVHDHAKTDSLPSGRARRTNWGFESSKNFELRRWNTNQNRNIAAIIHATSQQ
jgi:hypothetical protein